MQLVYNVPAFVVCLSALFQDITGDSYEPATCKCTPMTAWNHTRGDPEVTGCTVNKSPMDVLQEGQIYGYYTCSPNAVPMTSGWNHFSTETGDLRVEIHCAMDSDLRLRTIGESRTNPHAPHPCAPACNKPPDPVGGNITELKRSGDEPGANKGWYMGKFDVDCNGLPLQSVHPLPWTCETDKNYLIQEARATWYDRQHDRVEDELVVCLDFRCNVPEPTLNGRWRWEAIEEVDDKGTLPRNTIVTYKCAIGYDPALATAKCVLGQATAQSPIGSLSKDPPKCIVKICDAPPVVSHATYHASLPTFEFTTRVTYTCNKGYNMTEGVPDNTCTGDAEWSETGPVCSAIMCHIPIDPPNTSREPATETSSSTHPYGTLLSYQCNTGYQFVDGSSVIQCLEGGLWHGEPLVCQKVRCGQLPTIPNTVLSSISGYEYLDTVMYECSVHTQLESGNLSRSCTATGDWNGSNPVCKDITCPAPISIPNTVITSFTGMLVNDQVTYRCLDNFEMTSGSNKTTCVESGEWFPMLNLVCTEIRCSQPNQYIGDFELVTPLPNGASVGDSTAYMCRYDDNIGVGTCDKDGQWTTLNKTCEISTCPLPPALLRGSLLNTSASSTPDFVAGHVLQYMCEKGYAMIGNDTVECLTEGVWTTTQAQCKAVDCGDPSYISNSLADNNGTDYNSIAMYSCVKDYKQISGDNMRLCNDTGQWDGADIECQAVMCPTDDLLQPNVVLHGEKLIYTVRDEVMFTCEDRFKSSVSNVIWKCTESGVWEGDQLQCTAIQCPYITNTQNNDSVQMIRTNNTIGGIVTYYCKTNYSYVHGDLIRTCEPNGSWLGTEPECRKITCNISQIPLPFQHDIQNTMVDVGEIATLSCPAGYMMLGENNITCLKSGQWSEFPMCQPIQCPFPKVNLDMSVFMNCTTVNCTSLYTCHDTYNMTNGVNTRICMANGKWSEKVPVCQIVNCGKPTSINGSTWHQDDLSFVLGDVVTYRCKVRYKYIKGSQLRRCLSNGSWSGEDIVCEEDNDFTIYVPEPPGPRPGLAGRIEHALAFTEADRQPSNISIGSIIGICFISTVIALFVIADIIGARQKIIAIRRKRNKHKRN